MSCCSGTVRLDEEVRLLWWWKEADKVLEVVLVRGRFMPGVRESERELMFDGEEEEEGWWLCFLVFGEVRLFGVVLFNCLFEFILFEPL